MDLIADGLLFLGALTASLYCLVLSRRLRKLTQTESGLGKVIATLSQQVEELQAAMSSAKHAVEAAGGDLAKQTAQADRARRALEESITQAADQMAEVRAEVRELRADNAAERPLDEAATTTQRDGIAPELEPSESKGEASNFKSSGSAESDAALTTTAAETEPDDKARPLARDHVSTDLKSESAPGDVDGRGLPKNRIAEIRTSQKVEGREQAEEEASEPEGKAVPQAIATTVTKLLATSISEDDEAFSRRLIEALSGADHGVSEAV